MPVSLWVRGLCKILTKDVLAWYEAEGKKRPRSPSPDDHNKGKGKGPDEGTLWYHCGDVAVELIVKSVEQISSLVRGCRKQGVVGASTSMERLVMMVRKQRRSLKKVVSSD